MIAVTAAHLEEIVCAVKGDKGEVIGGGFTGNRRTVRNGCDRAQTDPARYRGAPRVACQMHSKTCRI